MIIRLPTALTRFRHAKSPYIIVIGSAGQRVYTAVFAGDSTYGASSGTVTVTVKYGALFITHLRRDEQRHRRREVPPEWLPKGPRRQATCWTENTILLAHVDLRAVATGSSVYTDNSSYYHDYGLASSPTTYRIRRGMLAIVGSGVHKRHLDGDVGVKLPNHHEPGSTAASELEHALPLFSFFNENGERRARRNLAEMRCYLQFDSFAVPKYALPRYARKLTDEGRIDQIVGLTMGLVTRFWLGIHQRRRYMLLFNDSQLGS